MSRRRKKPPTERKLRQNKKRALMGRKEEKMGWRDGMKRDGERVKVWEWRKMGWNGRGDHVGSGESRKARKKEKKKEEEEEEERRKKKKKEERK